MKLGAFLSIKDEDDKPFQERISEKLYIGQFQENTPHGLVALIDQDGWTY